MKVTVDGKEHDVVHSFGEARAIINFDGVFVFVDRAFDGVWELSGEPARDGEEKQVLNKLIAPHLDAVDVKVTPGDG
jgi:hypothetical protein